MKSTALLIALVLLTGSSQAAPFNYQFDGHMDVQPDPVNPPPPPPPGNVQMSINLAGVNYYSTALPFKNGMKYAEGWYFPDFSLVSNEIPTDIDGYPLQIPTTVGGQPKTVQTLLYRDMTDKYPSGPYVLLYKGTGDLDVAFDGKITKKTPGRIEFTVDASGGGGILIKLNQSSAADHVHDMVVVRLEDEGTYVSKPFNQAFIDRLQGFGVIRFMDWGNTNSNFVTAWEDRSLPNYFAQGTQKGVAYEYMIALANEMHADPWICVPHRADDNYMTQLAMLVESQLEPGRKVYIEYGNEVWNEAFPQTTWAKDQGCAAGLNLIPPENGSCSDPGVKLWAAIKFQARRSGKMFQIFQQTLSSTHPLVRVGAGQAADSSKGKNLFIYLANSTINPTGVKATALAIAPYFGTSIANDLVAKGQVGTITVAQILQQCLTSIQQEAGPWTASNKTVANQNGVDLIGYEGGQHLVGSLGNENIQALTDKLIAANHDPAMENVYDALFVSWKNNGLEMANIFNHIGSPSKWGSWGIMDDQAQDPNVFPKYRAVKKELLKLAQ